MDLKLGFKLSLFLLITIVGHSFAAINFGERNSAIKIANGATLNVDTNLSITDGSLIRENQTGSNITGATIYFSKARLDSGDSESFITADYEPTGEYDVINLNGDKRVRAEPGTIYQTVNARNSRNSLEGQPTFRDNITLYDLNTSLTIAIQSSLNKNIIMNGGTLYLGDDLKLSDEIQLLGSGKVVFQDRRLSLGGKDLSVTSSLYMDNANDIVLYSKLHLTGTWTFEGENHIIGNGHMLDLTGGGTIWVKKDAVVHMKDIKIKGLGSGYFVFENKFSQIRFSDVEVEMDANTTITEGGIYVEGPTTITTKAYYLTFDCKGSLTVDGITLWYDPLNYGDHDNIRPEPLFDTNDANTYITLVNGGIIRLKAGEGEGAGQELGDLYYNENDPGSVQFTTDMFLSSDRRMFVNRDMEIDGNNHYIQFSRGNVPQIYMRGGKTLTFKNVVLRDFNEDQIQGSARESVLFSDGTTIELGEDETLNSTWTFSGDCIVKGQGNYLYFGTNGEIVMPYHYGYIYFKDIILEALNDYKLRSRMYSSGVFFQDSKIMLDGTFTWSMGYLDAYDGLLEFAGTGTYVLESAQRSWIWEYSTLKFDKGLTFSYAPIIMSHDRLYLSDPTAQLFLNGATLRSTTTGLHLALGSLILDHKNYIFNERTPTEHAASLSEAVRFGDGASAANDLKIEVMPGGSIDIKTGILDYQNVQSAVGF